jgi:hypothetical protein
MKKSCPKGMTEEEFEKYDFKLFMKFVKAHKLKNPEELEALLEKLGNDYLHKWKFEELIKQEGIESEEEWQQFLLDNPVIPTF